MMIEPHRYTGGRIALTNLSASINMLDRRRKAGAGFDDLASLSELLFLRGDVLGRIADHDRAEQAALEAVDLSPNCARALLLRAQLAARFHRFEEVGDLLDRARKAGHPKQEIDAEAAALLQATGAYEKARALREHWAASRPTIQSLGALATLMAEMGELAAAETLYAAAIDADDGASPFPCAQLLFEWGVSAMRAGALDRAETVLAQLEAILPDHVPGRGHRTEVALARGQLDLAQSLIAPLVESSDDPEYGATYAEILSASGDRRAAIYIERAATAYEALLARRPLAYLDHAAAFYLGVGDQPRRALQLAESNFRLRDTPRSRKLLAKAQKASLTAEAAL